MKTKRTATESKDSFKFNRLAGQFVDELMKDGKYPLCHGGRFYTYDGTKYVEEKELDHAIRTYFKTYNLSQSNNVIGNVRPIVENTAHVPTSKYGAVMPFYTGNAEGMTTANIVAFKNGLLRLDRYLVGDLKLLPHTPKWKSTFCLPFEFDPAAQCPRWKQFLVEVFEGDDERAALSQEIMGYCLTLDNSLHKAFVLIGKPGSGKGTWQRVLQGLVGQENFVGFSLDQLAKEFGCSALVNKMVAIVGEVELSGNPSRGKIVETFKNITGDDPISINRKFDPDIGSARLPTRFVIATNTIPRLMDASGAVLRRMIFVPFQRAVPINQRDTNLETKLLAELPGICTWALEGLARLRRNNGKFTVGSLSQEAASGFETQTASVTAWLKSEMLVNRRCDPGDLPDDCLTDEDVKISKMAARNNYNGWAELVGVDPITDVWLSRTIADIVPKIKMKRLQFGGEKQEQYYVGLGSR